MASHSISVTVGTDSIRVEPDTLTMTSADEVQWKSTNSRAFSLIFEDERPFGRRQLDHAAATARQRARAKGRFKYSVVSDENPSLILDPVVVVGDPPSQTDP